MKRFYKKVAINQRDNGYNITLDGKEIRAPSRQMLKLPTPSLAKAVADEWRAQTDEIQPSSMPLTQLANSAIDQTRPNRTRVIEQVAAYARTDLLCYRVADPADLADRQTACWQPLLDWCRSAYGANLSVTTDLAPIDQKEESLLAVFTAVARLNDFSLTGLGAATAASGSVVIGLALMQDRLSVEDACACALLDEEYQSEKWGEDPEATKQRDSIRHAIAVAADFMKRSQHG